MADRQQHEQQHYSIAQGHHFLVVASYGVQSHINPARALAHRLARLSHIDGRSILATLSVPVTAQRRMFPSADSGGAGKEENICSDSLISYVPYANGFDDITESMTADAWVRRRRMTAASLSEIVQRFADGEKPVTCIVFTMVTPAVVDVAAVHGIPFAVYWIQPATILATEYHYFHGYRELIACHAGDPAHTVSLPGLSHRLRIRDLPSFLLDTTGSVPSNKARLEMYREQFESMDQWRPTVLINTFEELEASELAEMKRNLDVITVGPMIGVGHSSTEARIHLFEHDDDVDKKRYMEWLEAHPDRSVVYVSFGGVTKLTRQQMDQVVAGLRQCGRPYLLVVRRDGLVDNERRIHGSPDTQSSQGMVVDWCDQLVVLSHPAVGCFVSHCGWNSTVEAIASGVPIVGVPHSGDQPMNAYLVEEVWEVGIRAWRNNSGVLTGTVLARCIELVMGDGARAVAIREKIKGLKVKAQAAASSGGSIERNLHDFVKSFQASKS